VEPSLASMYAAGMTSVGASIPEAVARTKELCGEAPDEAFLARVVERVGTLRARLDGGRG